MILLCAALLVDVTPILNHSFLAKKYFIYFSTLVQRERKAVMAQSTAPVLLLFLTISSSLASTNNFPASTISAAPALSPDISPLFPTPHPESSSLPIIPSTPSPPKPDDDAMAEAPGPDMAVAPSRFLQVSFSSSSYYFKLMNDGRFLSAMVVVSGLVTFGLL